MSDAPPGTLTFPPDRQRTWGRWVRRLFVLFGVLAVLFLTASFALSRYLEPERLARWVEPRIEAAVNRQVEVDRLSVSFLPLGIRLEGLEVADPTGLAPALAEVESLEFRVRLLPLIRRQVQVREIVVEGLAADLQVDADGRSNYGDFSPSEDAPELDSTGDPPFALELDGIRLLSGRVAYRSQADGTVLRVEELAGESSVRQEVGGPWQVDGRFTGRVSAGDGPMGTSSPDGEAGGWIHDLPVTLELALDVADDGESLHVREGTVGVEELGLAVTGEVHGLKEPVREVELALLARQVPLGRALSLVPDSVMDPAEVEADGTLSADLAIRGRMGPGETPDVTGITALAGGTVRYRGRTLTEGLEMEVELPGDGSLRPRGTGQLLGGGFRIDGTVMTDEPRAVDLRIEAAPDLSRIDPDFLPPGVELAGLTPMELTLAGELSDPGGLGAWGELGLRQLRVTHPALGVPVSVATADLTLEGRTARIPGMELRLGQDRLTVDGVLSGLLAAMGDGVPDFRGTVRGPRLSLADLNASPPPDSAVTYGRLAFARVGDRRVRGLSADAAARDRGFSRPTSLPVAGEVQASIDTVLDRKGRMEEVRATVRFGPDFVQVTDADFRRYGGRIRTSANLEFGDDATEPFSFDLAVEGVEAGDFLGETTPLGQAITGTLDMRVAFTGALNRLLLPTRESLQGRGSFALTGGGVDSRVTERLATFLGVDGLRQLRLQDWSSGFTLRDGQVVLEESILRGAPGSPQVGGGIALNGELDLVAAFDLPRQEVAASALERLGFADAGRQVRAVVRVRGTVDDPRIEADPEASVAEWTEGLEEEAQEEIDQVLREQQEALEERATSFLRGLLGGSRGAAGDTLPPDTLAPDTIRPDTFPRTPLPGG